MLGKNGSFLANKEHRAVLADALSKTSDYNLKQTLNRGTAFHHAGLQPSDRQLVESLFMKNQVRT